MAWLLAKDPLSVEHLIGCYLYRCVCVDQKKKKKHSARFDAVHISA